MHCYSALADRIAVQHPDMVEVSYIVARESAQLDTSAIDSFCAQRIARFKRPRHYRIVGTLPKNSYGKVLKKALRELEQLHGD